MKFRHPVFRALPFIVLVWGLLSAPAQAQLAQQGLKLVGTGGQPGDGELAGIGNKFGVLQGASVSLSDDGNTIIIGGPGDESIPSGGLPPGARGAAWVFARSGGMWTQQAMLVGSAPLCPCDDIWEGSSVALSGDGNTALVGGPSNFNFTDGRAWVFTRSDGVWTQQGPALLGIDEIDPNIGFDAQQGWSVALSADGNTALVGGPHELVDFPHHVGAAWVFARANGAWTQQGPKLVGSDAVEDAHSGWSVALSADGNTAVVGGPGDNGGVGAAWVFTRSDGVWTQQGPRLVGTDAVGNAGQGTSVSLSADGNTALIGGPSDNGGVGATWVFAQSGGMWSQQGPKLVGTGAIGVAGQGGSVSLSGDGNTAIVGGSGDNNSAGAAWVFTRSEGVWSQQILVGSGAGGAALQGYSVALSPDASTAIVGGPGDNNNAGAAWVYSEFVFPGTPGTPSCVGQRTSAIVRQYGGLNGAAAALGFASVGALQNAVLAFCGG
jgi:hypothetical protein